MTVIFLYHQVFCYEILDMEGYVLQVRSYLVNYLFNYFNYFFMWLTSLYNNLNLYNYFVSYKFCRICDFYLSLVFYKSLITLEYVP